MKFAARDGSSARTLAVTALPGLRRSVSPSPVRRVAAAGGLGTAAASLTRPRPAIPGIDAGSNGGRGRQQRPSTLTYLSGQEIFSPGNGGGLVYIVRAGCVRLYKTLPDGRAINLGLLGPNTIFTQEDSYEGLASGATAAALADSTLSVVEATDLAQLIAESPELAMAVVTGMTRRLTELQTLVEQLLVRDTAVRLATTLLGLAHRFGRPTADGLTAITLPLTHQALANMIGSNRVTVTRKLTEMQTQRLVRTLGRNTLAVDAETLRRFAHAGLAAEAAPAGNDLATTDGSQPPAR